MVLLIFEKSVTVCENKWSVLWRTELSLGVPQGSVLGPLLFTLYDSPVSEIARHFNINNMFYADDSQLYVTLNPRTDFNLIITNLKHCIKQVKTWMQRNFLKLNDLKTEFI